jgi:hypothetical protein
MEKVMRRLKEEIAIGRNVHTADQVGNNDWEDYEGISTETIADAGNNQWLVTVHVEDDPSLSVPQRAFSSEVDAQAWARSETERIRNQMLNLQEVRKFVRMILLEM